MVRAAVTDRSLARRWFPDLRPRLSVMPRITLDPWWFPEPCRPPAVAEVCAPCPVPLPGWKREALLAVIGASPGAPDREVARIAGVDHNTVAAYRKRGGPPLGQKRWARQRAAAILAAGEKLCPRCGKVRSLEAFARASRPLDGRQCVCRSCMSDYKQTRGQHQPARPYASSREWPPGWDEESAAALVYSPPPSPPQRRRPVASAAVQPPSLASLAAWGGLAAPARFGRGRRDRATG